MALHAFYLLSLYREVSIYGRPKGIRYPGGVGVAFGYNASGYLVQEKDASSSYVLRQVTARDSRNQTIQSTLADGLLSHTAEYYDASGQMKSISVSGSAGTLHELDYQYDIYGNLQSHSTSYPGATASETFYYDDLHRLVQSNRSTPGGSATVNYDYDASGNLTLKDDYASSYAYAGSRPNAVSSVTKVVGGTVHFSYDANGNLLTGDGKSVSYNAHNLPITVVAGGVTAGFAYGADLARFRQGKSSGAVTLYIDKLMEVVQVGSTFDYRHYLGDVAVLTKTGDLNDPAPEFRFLLRDRLGSVVTVTDATGQVDEVRGYDPFGKPREGDWANKTPPVVGSAITDRGFTDHEHLDESQLIHMNGRAYDYNLGRFLSVDPVIQAPGNSQSLNPYSYIMNNPLAGTDPSGYSCKGTRIGSDSGSICGGRDSVEPAVIADNHAASSRAAGGNGARQSTTAEGTSRSSESVTETNAQAGDYVTSVNYGSESFDNLGEIGIDFHALAQAEAELGEEFVDNLLGDLINDPQIRSSSGFSSLQSGIGRHYENRAASNALDYYVPSGAIKAAVGALTYTSGRVASDAAAVRVTATQLTGQMHHGISRTIQKALERHPNLRGAYQARDPRFVTQARDALSHRGYQRWHRDLDVEVAGWIRGNPNATQAQFESYLRGVYQRPDVLERFPNGL